jgi:hypothetical protein
MAVTESGGEMVSDSARELRLRPADGCGLRLGGGRLSKLGGLGWALGLLIGASKIQARFIRVSFHGSFASAVRCLRGGGVRAGRIDMCAAVLWMLLGSHGVMAVEEITGVNGGGR